MISSISDLEKNLTIGFVWLVFRSIYDYSRKLSYVSEDREGPESSFIVFLFSFLIIYLVSSTGIIILTLTFDFWTQIYQLDFGYLWWLPAALAIIFMEVSSWFCPKAKGGASPLFQETIFTRSRIISFYLLFIFLFLAVCWGVLLKESWRTLPIKELFAFSFNVE